jgi:hypothetical protein
MGSHSSTCSAGGPNVNKMSTKDIFSEGPACRVAILLEAMIIRIYDTAGAIVSPVYPTKQAGVPRQISIS